MVWFLLHVSFETLVVQLMLVHHRMLKFPFLEELQQATNIMQIF